MSLEQAINANTQAINNLIAFMQKDIPRAAKEVVTKMESKAEDKTDTKVTIDDVRNAVMSVIKATDQETGHGIIKEFGADILPKIKEKDYLAVIARCEELLS